MSSALTQTPRKRKGDNAEYGVVDSTALSDSNVMTEHLTSPKHHRMARPKPSTPDLSSPIRKLGLRARKTPYASPCKAAPTRRSRRSLASELTTSPNKELELNDDYPCFPQKTIYCNLEKKIASTLQKSPRKYLTNKSNSPVFGCNEEASNYDDGAVSSPRNIGRRILHHTSKCISETVAALHSSIPDIMMEREKEVEQITLFITENCHRHTPKSLYISGKPGTGKTACVMKICEESKVKNLLEKVIHINCMSITSTAAIYQKLSREMGGKGRDTCGSYHSRKYVESYLNNKTDKMILIVLDEMDQLDSSEGDVLYQIFGWISLNSSRMILIGIANSLDLTDRMLSRLQFDQRLKPQLLNFKPYSEDQLVKIIEARLPQEEKYSMIDRIAIQLCARKVAAKSGDARSSLDICRRALEMTAQQNADGKAKKVGISQIDKLMSSSTQATMKKTSDGETLPFEQKLVICSLFKITRKQKVPTVGVSKLYEVYCGSCKQGSGLTQSDFFSVCQSLEDRRVFDIKKNKMKSIDRQSKVKFAILEADIIESYFKGDCYFESLLKEFL